MAKWEAGYEPNQVATRLEKAKNIQKNGVASFETFTHTECTVILNSMLCLNSEIPQDEKKRIIYEATFNIGAKGVITASKLLSDISELESQYLSKPAERYRLVTSISIDRSCKLKRCEIDGCTISFSPTLSGRLAKSRTRIIDYAQNSICGEMPTNYTNVIAGVRARSHNEAVEKALDAIDLLRSIWNSFHNSKVQIRISSGKRKPVNKYISGPIHTLHKPDGNLATDSWWYDPEYVSQVTPYDPAREIERIYKFTRSIRRLIRKSSYSSDLKASLRRYTRALDLTNWESAFLRLWSVLELLTVTGPGEGYKVTVKRASFIFGGEGYTRQVLTHLRNYRNLTVHKSAENHDIEVYMYQMKRIVEGLLRFHLNNIYDIKSLKHAAQFLDLPNDRHDLQKRRRMPANANNS